MRVRVVIIGERTINALIPTDDNKCLSLIVTFYYFFRNVSDTLKKLLFPDIFIEFGVYCLLF